MIERVRAGVWWFRLGWVPPLMQNAYLVDDGEVTLVDAGMPWDARRLRRYLRRAGYRPADLDRVLVTHYDLDHVGSLGRLGEEATAPAYLGRRDLALAGGDWTPPLVHHKGAFHRLLRRLYGLPAGVEFRPVEDGDAVGGFVAHHAPGHNPGHVVYHHGELDAAFLGDLVWASEGRLTTPIRLDSYDLDRLADSVRDLAGRLPPFELACPGHGQPLERDGLAALRSLAGSL